MKKLIIYLLAMYGIFMGLSTGYDSLRHKWVQKGRSIEIQADYLAAQRRAKDGVSRTKRDRLARGRMNTAQVVWHDVKRFINE
jgi:hypothetical protein